MVRPMVTKPEPREAPGGRFASPVRRLPPQAVLAGILLLGLGLRAIQFTNPLLGHQSWRQTDTAAIARNFVEEDFDLLRPRIDWRGSTSGEVESEFPAFTFLTACLYRVFGVREWIGRALAIACSLLAIFLWHRLVRALAGEAAALWSAFFLAVLPLPVFFGRAFMPESLLLASLAGGLYFYTRYDRSGSRTFLLASALAFALAASIKPPALHALLAVAWMAFRRHGVGALRRPELWGFVVVVLLPPGLWFLHARSLHRATGLSFGVWEAKVDKWWNWDLVFSGEFWSRVFGVRISGYLLAWFGVVPVLLGMTLQRGPDGDQVMRMWLLGTLIFIVVVARGVFVHDYYVLPAVLPLSYFLGRCYATLCHRKGDSRRWAYPLLVLCLVGTSVVSVSHLGKLLRREAPDKSSLFRLAQAAELRTASDSLIIAVDRGNPAMLYHAHRKGWHASPAEITDARLDDLQARGAGYVVGLRGDFEKDRQGALLDRLLTDSRRRVVLDDGTGFIVGLRRR